MTDEQIHEMFDTIDGDGKGSLDLHEMVHMMEALGLDGEEAEAEADVSYSYLFKIRNLDLYICNQVNWVLQLDSVDYQVTNWCTRIPNSSLNTPKSEYLFNKRFLVP